MNNIDIYRTLLTDLNYGNEMLMTTLACKHYEEMNSSFRQLTDSTMSAGGDNIRVSYQESASRIARNMTEILYHLHAMLIKFPYSAADVMMLDSIIERIKSRANKETIDDAINISTGLVKKYRLNELKQRHQLYRNTLASSEN